MYRPIKYLERHEDQLIIQTWHALGAFKKFGLANVENLIKHDNEDEEELQTIHVYDYTLDPGLKFRDKYFGYAYNFLFVIIKSNHAGFSQCDEPVFFSRYSVKHPKALCS